MLLWVNPHDPVFPDEPDSIALRDQITAAEAHAATVNKKFHDDGAAGRGDFGRDTDLTDRLYHAVIRRMRAEAYLTCPHVVGAGVYFIYSFDAVVVSCQRCLYEVDALEEATVARTCVMCGSKGTIDEIPVISHTYSSGRVWSPVCDRCSGWDSRDDRGI